jgi:hypothetical protein
MGAFSMLILRIAGFLLAALSAVVFWIVMGGLWRMQRSLNLSGINEPVPLDGKSRLIIFGWLAAFIVGLGLIVLSFS